jgi:hypothetical protein
VRGLRAAILAACAAAAAAVVAPAGAAAPRCPTETFLSFGHLAYVSKDVPATVRLAPGSGLGGGLIDEPASSDGCKRRRESVDVVAAGPIEPRVAVMATKLPRTVFVIGHRCSGTSGAAYWSCLLQPLAFQGRRYTGTSYPSEKTVPLGAAVGKGALGGKPVTVRRIEGVDPALAVGVAGRPSEAFLTAPTCPYEGFASAPAYDDLLRCLRSPVWFTFDPPGGEPGATIVARSDRPPGRDVTGAQIGLVRLPLVADFIPKRHAPLVGVGRVAQQVGFAVPDVPAGLYEVVVSCPRCASAQTLFPSGSILVTGKRKTSLGIRIVSYALTAALVAAVVLLVRTWRRRRRTTSPGSAGS